MQQKMTRWQKVGFFVASLLPTLYLLLGLFMLLGGTVLTLSYVITYLLLPIACLFLLLLAIRSQKSTIFKWSRSLLILGLSAFLAIQLMMWGHFSIYDHITEDDPMDTYNHYIAESGKQIPLPDELGQLLRAEYHYFYNQQGAIFESECFTLICTYSPEDYAAITGELDTRYTFHTEPLDAGETDLPPLYTLDGYEFRFLEMHTDTYRLTYPHYMILIGTNDKTQEIVWSYYDDDDLDYIPDPEDFLLEDCGWKYIR